MKKILNVYKSYLIRLSKDSYLIPPSLEDLYSKTQVANKIIQNLPD